MLRRNMHEGLRCGPYDHDLLVAIAVAIGRRVAIDRSMTIGRSAIGRNVVMVVDVNLAVAVVDVSADMTMVANMTIAVMTLEVVAMARSAVAVAMPVTRAMTGLGSGGGGKAEGESESEKSFHCPDPFRWLGAGEVARVRCGDRCNPCFMSTFIEQRSE